MKRHTPLSRTNTGIPNFSMVEKQLLQAAIYVCETEGIIQGFIGMTGEYIAGLFVDRASRCLGVGAQLLNYAKQVHNTLSLSVYEKNIRAAAFYLREGFSIVERKLDEDTGETEYIMIWKNPAHTRTDDSKDKPLVYCLIHFQHNDGG